MKKHSNIILRALWITVICYATSNVSAQSSKDSTYIDSKADSIIDRQNPNNPDPGLPDPPPHPVVGDERELAINVGSKSADFSYSDTQNTNNFTNQYTGLITKDVFYRFTLTVPMNVTMTHQGSTVTDTYMYLLDSAGNLIESNDNYSGEGCCTDTTNSFIRRVLAAGTYYVVSEGVSLNGKIKTNITGNKPTVSDYPVIPSTYSTESSSVGAMGGQFGVSPMGGATYSIPIEVPLGVNGMQPGIAITYNSQSGNGLCGYGANITGLSAITRGPKNIYHDGAAYGMQYYGDDAFYLDGVRLILSSGTAGQDGAVYYPESDPYTKVLQHGTCYTGTNYMWFEVTNNAGVTCWYGYSTGRHKYYVSGNQKTLSWNLMYMVDPFGNELAIDYETLNNVIYPTTIRYGMNNRSYNPLQNYVHFSYETRPDSITSRFDNGVCAVMNRRLESITTKTGSSVYRQYKLNYNDTGDGTAYKFSRLVSVQEKNGEGETLPATLFTWSYLPAEQKTCNTMTVNSPGVSPLVSFPFSSQTFVSGDLNGDGRSDIIGIAPVGIPNNNGGYDYKTYAYVHYSSTGENDATQFVTGQNYVLPASFSNDKLIKAGVSGLSAVDLDGDGINELLLPYIVNINNSNSTVSFFVYGQNYPDGVGVSHGLYGTEMPLYSPADFDNDGKGDIVFIETTPTSGSYPMSILTYNTAYGNAGALFFNHADYNLLFDSEPSNLFAADLNGNGLTDMLVICSNGYKIYWNQGGSTLFLEQKTTTGTELKDCSMVRAGDFNGDGLLDILTNAEGSSDWHFHINQGDGTFSKMLACSLGVYELDFTAHDDDKFACQVIDFDADGKSDVVITKSMYDRRWSLGGYYGEFNKTHTYWMRSGGTTLTQVYHATSDKPADGQANRYLNGDFDADGYVELVNYGYDCAHGSNSNSDPVWRIYKNSNLTAQSGKVTSITGDFGATANITYSTLTDPDVYTRGTSTPYPAPKYTLPINVVKTVVQNNGAAGSMTTDYSYSGLRIHLQGKGVLGFCSTEADNVTLGTTVTSTVTGWNDTFYVPSQTRTRTGVGSSFSQQTTTLTILDKGQKKYFAYPSLTEDLDFDGNSVNTIRSIVDSIGLPATETVQYEQNMYRTVEYADYIMAGRRYQPQTVVSRQRHPDDSSEFSNTLKNSYDSTTGALIQSIDGFGKDKPLTTNYTYTAYGHVFSKQLSGNGIDYYVQYYGYDNTKRFLTKEYSSPTAYVMEYTYDTWGNRITETDNSNTSYPVTVTHTYDGWGNLIRTQMPDGGEVTYTRGWNSSDGKRYFILTQGTDRPWVKTWYDNQGREVQTESVGPMNVNVGSSTGYDKGQVSDRTEINGDLTLSYSYTYDERGRIVQEDAPGGRTVSYQYANRTVSVTENSNVTTTTTYDAWGNVVSVSAPESGTITNTYKSNGGINTTVSGGATWSFGYDDRGNRTSITDPDAGTTTYVFDALGRERQRIDARGFAFVTNYDYLGRVTYVSASDNSDTETIYYTYGTSGTGKFRLVAESLNGWIKGYSYDQYGRVTEETMSKAGTTTRNRTYTYGNTGLLDQTELPYEKAYSYLYDPYGNLTGVDGADNSVIWRLTGCTGRHTVSSTSISSDYAHPFVKTHLLDQYGLLDSIKTVQNGCYYQTEDYNFSPLTGNLISKRDGSAYPTNYSYDSADRLTTVQRNNQTMMSMTYGSNGNILSKSEMGSYEYGNPSKPHAVTAIQNPDDMLAVYEQEVKYNLWGKVSDVWHFDGWDYYHYHIDYGPDLQRVSSTLYRNNQVEYEKFYWGDYEEKNAGGQDARYWYVNAPDGLAGICYQESSNNGTWSHVTAAMTDHLGSILYLADDCDYCLYNTYDPWGFREPYIDYYQQFDRGFCGHEHIDALGLIDMNGRMYDPNLGRFLSVDPYVQAPVNPQNYNRYSYCLNNPLKYTDPSGESIIGAVIVGAVVGTYMGGVLSNEGEKNPFNWNYKSTDTWCYMACGLFVGAMSGAAGGYIASSGIPMANTASMATSSLINSFGTWGYTGGQTDISMSFGFCSYDFTKSSFGAIWDKKNTTLDYIGYGLGAFSNLNDINNLFDKTIANLYTQTEDHGHFDKISHSAIVSKYKKKIMISYGPGGDYKPDKWNGFLLTARPSTAMYNTHISETSLVSKDLYLNKYLFSILRRISEHVPYQGMTSNCVNWSSIGLWLNGIPNIGIHPFLLHASVAIYNTGVYNILSTQLTSF